jgi:hypothetical protein
VLDPDVPLVAVLFEISYQLALGPIGDKCGDEIVMVDICLVAKSFGNFLITNPR